MSWIAPDERRRGRADAAAVGAFVSGGSTAAGCGCLCARADVGAVCARGCGAKGVPHTLSLPCPGSQSERPSACRDRPACRRLPDTMGLLAQVRSAVTLSKGPRGSLRMAGKLPGSRLRPDAAERPACCSRQASMLGRRRGPGAPRIATGLGRTRPSCATKRLRRVVLAGSGHRPVRALVVGGAVAVRPQRALAPTALPKTLILRRPTPGLIRPSDCGRQSRSSTIRPRCDRTAS